jgi:chemotaxis signal transduction protein
MATNEQEPTRGTRELFMMRAGEHLFAVFAEEVEGEAEGLTPTPLPNAPSSVVGVVSLRGRIRTALDPAQLFADTPTPQTSTHAPRLFVALRGDEQLALACDAASERIEIAVADILPLTDAHAPAHGTVERSGARITLLDPARLFEAAMRGIDRRRKRS